MNKFKRILAVLMSVILLSITVGSDYFDATHMDKVEAAELAAGAGITVATIFQICLFIGSVIGVCYVAGEVIDNQEEIARAGKNFIDSIKEVPEGWLFTMTDTSTGQEYVFGNEVIEYIQSCTWLAILNGAPGPDNDNNDDKNDDDKKDSINLVSPSNVGNFLALGATWFISHASELYQKWVNGEEMTETELAAVEPFLSGYCNQYDIAGQWSGTFTYSGVGEYSYTNTIGNTLRYSYDYTLVNELPICGYYHVDTPLNTSSNWSSWYYLDFLKLNDNSEISALSLPYTRTAYKNGVLQSSSTGSSQNMSLAIISDFLSFSFSYGLNFPVFASRIDAENYLKGTGDVTKSLNYAKVYRHADWLSDDWAGQLIDPLTNIGLTLNQLLELMKALGLNAIGNNLSPDELADLLRRSLPVVNPELLPDETPVTIPDTLPGAEPVYYPSPDSHPLPVTPNPTPNPNPDPDPDPNPGADPDIEMSDYKVELSGIFPFCIPFDFIALLKVLSAEPEAPCFSFPIVIPALDYEETVYLDLSIFDDVAKVMRTCEKVSFIIFLMFATSKVIRW